MSTINEIKDRVNKSSNGPWEWYISTDRSSSAAIKKIAKLCSLTEKNSLHNKKVIIDQESWYVFPEEKDREFIAYAKEDIPYLLKKIEKIQSILTQRNHCHNCDLFDVINKIILE